LFYIYCSPTTQKAIFFKYEQAIFTAMGIFASAVSMQQSGFYDEVCELNGSTSKNSNAKKKNI
jgi:hypothetical protein